MAIRWRPQDVKKLTSAVRKFNTSITKLSKQHPEMADAGLLPAKLDINKVKSDINTRVYYNRVINRIERWFKKGARDIVTLPGGIRTTRWQKKEAQYMERSVKAREKEYVKKLGITESEAKKEGLIGGTLAQKFEEIKERLKDQSKRNFTTVQNEQQSFRNFLKNLARRESETYFDEMNARFRQNFYKSLDINFTPMQAAILKRIIESLGMTDGQFFYMIKTNDQIDIEYHYGPEQRQDKFEFMVEEIPRIYAELKQEGVFD